MEPEVPGETGWKSQYSVRRAGRPFSEKYRIFFERKSDGLPVSPFHDIPLYRDKDKGVLNMVVEVPRWTNAKFEVRARPGLLPDCSQKSKLTIGRYREAKA